MPHFRTFAEALRAHRKAAGLTQVELAVLAKTSRGEVTSLESGKIKAPHPVTAEVLASALDLDGPEREHFLALARGRESTVPQASQPAQLPLVGRRTELALLDALLDGHGPPALFVAGEPGIGKTRFLAESARLAQARGWQVVTGGCTRQSGQEPYAPWPGALGRHLAATPVAAQRQRLQGCAWLVRLLPELAEGHLVPTPSWTLPPAQERRLVVQAVGRYLANCAGPAGTLLVLDDLQWAGDDAIALLANLVPGEDGTREPLVRLLGAYRSTEVRPAQPLGVFLADLAKDAQVTKRALPLLTDEEAGQLLEEAVREHDLDGESSDQDITAVREQLVRRAHGLPFALISSVRALKSGVPLAQLNTKDALSDGIRARVAALADLAQRLLGIAAVIGRVSPVRLLLTLAQAEEEATLEALDDIAHAGLMAEETAETVAFIHDLIREVIEGDLSAPRRKSLHRRIAEAMAQTSPGTAAYGPAEIAIHYHAADELALALPYALQAAERAHDAGARREEATLLAHALDAANASSDHILVSDLHEKRGKALIAATMWVEGIHELELARGSLASDQIEKRIAILLELANGCYFGAPYIAHGLERARIHATEALALAEGLEDNDLAARAISELAIYDTNDGLVRESQVLFERAFARACADRIAALLPGLDQYGLNCYYLGAFAEAESHTRHALDIARTTRDPQITVRTLGNLGMTLTSRGQYDEALATFAEARRLGREFGTWQWLARSISMSAGLYLTLGDYATAESVTEEARQLSQSVPFPNGTASSGVDLLLIYARQQVPDRAEGLLLGVEEAVAKTVASHHWLLRMRFAQAQAEVALARGAPEEAMRHALDGIAQARQRGRVKYETLGMQTHAQALHALGRTKEAIAELRAALERSRPVGDPALFLRAASALLAIEGDDALLVETWATVEQMAAALPDELRRVFLDAEPTRLIAHLRR